MVTRTTKPPMFEIFDEEDNEVENNLRRSSEVKANDFDAEFEKNAADLFERELQERIEDEQYNDSNQNITRNLEEELGSVKTQPSEKGSDITSILGKWQDADDDTRYLMGEAGVAEITKEHLRALIF